MIEHELVGNTEPVAQRHVEPRLLAHFPDRRVRFGLPRLGPAAWEEAACCRTHDRDAPVRAGYDGVGTGPHPVAPAVDARTELEAVQGASA